MRVGTRLAKTEWKSLPDLWTQSKILCLWNTTCDCPDTCQCLFCNKQMLFARHGVSWSWVLPARLRRARTACILLPHFCSGHMFLSSWPFMFFCWLSFLGSDCFWLCEKVWLCQEHPQEQLGNETSLCVHEGFILPFTQAVMENQYKWLNESLQTGEVAPLRKAAEQKGNY